MAFLAQGTGIGDALIRIGADTRQIRAEMAAMNAQIKGEMAATGQTIEKGAAGWGKAFQLAKIGLIGLGVGLAAFTVDAVVSVAAFDKAMAKVYALTGITGTALEGVRKQTLELAKVVPQSPTKLAEGLYYVISAGFSAADALKVLKVAAMDASVGLTDTQTVADGLTSAMNAYGYSADQAAHVSDIMTAAVTAGKMQWADLAGAIGAVSVTGATAKVRLEEITAGIATMTRDGLSASRAATGLRFSIQFLENPSSAAAKLMKILGVTVNATTLAHDGLYATYKKLSDAAGVHHDVIVRSKNGNIDYAKSLAATAAANKGWASQMAVMTGGARGFLAAQVLLQGGGKTYNDILKQTTNNVGLTTTAFDKMKAADPGMMLQLLINRVQVAAIEFGTFLMPKLAAFAGWVADALPKAFQIVADIWHNILEKPVGAMMDAFGKLAGAIAGIFGGTGLKQGNEFETVVSAIAGVMKDLAGYITTVATVMTGLFSNPIIRGLTQVVGLLIAARVAVNAIVGMGSGLNRMFQNTARQLTGGFLFGNQTAKPGNAPLDRSASNLDSAAVAHKEAAAALKGAAVGLRGGPGAGLTGQAAQDAVISSEKQAVAARASAAARQAAIDAGFIGPTLAEAGMTADAEARSLRQKLAAAGDTVKGALSKVGGALSGALGFVSKAFFPLMIAGLATEFLKAPISDLLAQNTPWKRAAASIKDDFVGGLVNMVKAWSIGSDLFVALPQIQLGAKTSIKTENLGKFNLTDAQVAAVQAGGLSGALATQQIEPGVIAALKQQAGESVQQWYGRIKDTLQQNGLDTSTIQKALTQTSIRGGYRAIKPEVLAAAQSQLAGLVTQIGDNALKGVTQAINDGVDQGLSGLGFTPGQEQFLSDAQKQKLALLITANTQGQFNALVQFTAQQALIAAQAPTRNITAKDVLKAQGGSNTPDESTHQLTTMAQAANIGFKESLDKNVQPAKDAFKQWYADVTTDPSGAKEAAMAAGQSFLDQWSAQIAGAKTDQQKAALAAKLHMTWDQVIETLAEAKLATGAPLVAQMSKVWRDTILQAAKDGSADAAPQAAQIFFDTNSAALGKANTEKAKAAFLKQYNAMFPKGSSAKLKDTAQLEAAYKSWLSTGMLDPTKPAAMKTAMTGLPGIADNTTTAMDTLRAAAESARISLVGVATVLGAIGGSTAPIPINLRDHQPGPAPNTPTLPVKPGKPGIPPPTPPPLTPPPTPTPSTFVVPHGARGFGGHIASYASGGRRPGGQAAWVGEFGPELWQPEGSGDITSTSRVRDMIAQVAKNVARAYAKGPRGDQTLYVDNMHLTSPAEKGAILEELAFLAPAGV